MNPLAMFFTMLTVYAVCNLIYAGWMFYRERRRDRALDAATRDSLIYGIGAMKDGKHIPHDQLYRDVPSGERSR